MTAATVVADYRADLGRLAALARRDLKAFLAETRGMDPARLRDVLEAILPDLDGPYTAAAAQVAAAFYDDLRPAPGVFAPVLADDVMSPELAGVRARWGVGPLFTGGSIDDVESLLGGALQASIFDSARDTISGSAAADPVKVGYQRMARPGACAFCGLLASRGAVYGDDSGRVKGRGSSRTGYDADGRRLRGGIGGGVKPRGSRAIGEKYHDDCKCVVVPVWAGTDMAELAASEEAAFADKYKLARNSASSSSTKDVLAAWRQINGTR